MLEPPWLIWVDKWKKSHSSNNIFQQLVLRKGLVCAIMSYDKKLVPGETELFSAYLGKSSRKIQGNSQIQAWIKPNWLNPIKSYFHCNLAAMYILHKTFKFRSVVSLIQWKCGTYSSDGRSSPSPGQWKQIPWCLGYHKKTQGIGCHRDNNGLESFQVIDFKNLLHSHVNRVSNSSSNNM